MKCTQPEVATLYGEFYLAISSLRDNSDVCLVHSYTVKGGIVLVILQSLYIYQNFCVFLVIPYLNVTVVCLTKEDKVDILRLIIVSQMCISRHYCKTCTTKKNTHIYIYISVPILEVSLMIIPDIILHFFRCVCSVN